MPNYDNYGKTIPSKLYQLQDGDRGIEETLNLMRLVALDASRDPRLRHLSILVVKEINPRDLVGRCAALLKWIQKNIHYVRDISYIETLQTPQRTLIWQAGDCDDFSILICSLLLSIGFSDQYLIAQRKISSNPFSHVYNGVCIDGKTYKADGTGKRPLSIFNYDPKFHLISKV